jgi:CheY-like chemotaxis protein
VTERSDVGVAPPDSTATILVVDDNFGKRLAMISVLEGLGHETVEAWSGEAALRAVLKQTFAVILMDVQMPKMDGYETARMIRLRDDSRHTPIIFVTSHERNEAQVADAYASGAVDFIFAPIVPDILRAKVTIFVDLHLARCRRRCTMSRSSAISSGNVRRTPARCSRTSQTAS